MACALTTGYTLDCKDSMGGIVELYFIAHNDIASYTEASGVISAITKDSGKRFYKYEQERETASMTENFTSNVQNGTAYFAQELVIVLNKLQVATRNELSLLVKNKLAAVVKDANGLYWLLGKTRGLDGTAGSAATGVASGDRNGYTFTFTGMEPVMAFNVNDACAATLETPGS